MRLDSNETRLDGRHALGIVWEGQTYVLLDDFDAAMSVLGAAEGGALTVAAAAVGLFEKPAEVLEAKDPAGLLALAMWEAFGLDLDGTHNAKQTDEKVLDWEEDADRVRATLRAEYGIAWEEARHSMAYRELVALIGMCGRQTPMGQALYYRCAPAPKPNKYNQSEIEAFRKLRAHYALGRPTGDAMGDMSKRNADAFAGLAGSARR